MRRVLIVFPLLGVLATGGFGQTTETDKVQNLRNCFAGFGECDRSLLTATQAGQISAMQHDRNLWKRLREYGCDRSALSETELKEVAETERLRNLLACERRSESVTKDC